MQIDYTSLAFQQKKNFFHPLNICRERHISKWVVWVRFPGWVFFLAYTQRAPKIQRIGFLAPRNVFRPWKNFIFDELVDFVLVFWKIEFPYEIRVCFGLKNTIESIDVLKIYDFCLKNDFIKHSCFCECWGVLFVFETLH